MPSASMPKSTQARIPTTYMRGGSSKALFFHEHDLPPAGPTRDRVLRRAMGSPDPLQIDGMGGTKAVTSKIAIIGPPTHPDADIDYTFVQVGVNDGMVDYTGNCGNISSAVGPFGIEEGLLRGKTRKGTSIDPRYNTQEVRMYQTGTKKLLVTHVPVDEDGDVVIEGDFSVAAVPGTGAPILMDFRNMLGAARNNGVLPTGNPIDTVSLKDYGAVEITICDVANIIVFVRSRDFGLDLSTYSSSNPTSPSFKSTTAAALTGNHALIASLKELRGKAAQLVGMCTDWEKVDEQSPFMPMVALVDSTAEAEGEENNISARLFLDNMCHESMAGTGASCLTACAFTRGTVVNQTIVKSGEKANRILGERGAQVMRIAHPRGIIPISVEVDGDELEGPKFKTLSFVRTARRIMDGFVYVPRSVLTEGEAEGKSGTLNGSK